MSKDLGRACCDAAVLSVGWRRFRGHFSGNAFRFTTGSSALSACGVALIDTKMDGVCSLGVWPNSCL